MKTISEGFTLLEVLIAMLVLAIALLGLAKLQTFGIKNTGNAYYKTQATLLLNEAVESLRIDQTQACPLPVSAPPEWLKKSLLNVQNTLPSGNIKIDDASPCKIIVSWTESAVDLDKSGAVDTEEEKYSQRSISMSISR